MGPFAVRVAQVEHDLALVLRDGPERPETFLFARQTEGKRMPDRGDVLWKPFHDALRLAKIATPGLSIYSLRNTFNSLAHKLGADGIVLRDIMGHSDASMTERYKRTEHDERAAVQAKVMAAVHGSLVPGSDTAHLTASDERPELVYGELRAPQDGLNVPRRIAFCRGRARTPAGSDRRGGAG